MKMKKGFTLIELLAVIAILAIIMLIATPRVLEAIEESRIEAYKQTKQMMIKAAETFLGNNTDQLPENIGDTVEITLADLKTNEFIGEVSDQSGSCDGYVLITKTASAYSYNTQLKCGDSNTIGSRSDDGLIGYWTLDNKTGVTDLSSSKNDGNINGELNIGNNQLYTIFDGIDDYIALDNPINLHITQSSLSWWMNISKPSGIFNYQIAGNQSYQSHIEYQGSYFFAETYSNCNYFNSPAFDSISNKWSFIALVFLNSEAYWYVDGKFIGNPSSYGSIDCGAEPTYQLATELRIQTIGALTYKPLFEGSLAEVKMYNRALSAEEIKYQYDTQKSIYK